jgi:Ca2+/Na+ antiporter
MSLIIDIIVAVPIGLLYNLIIHKLCETLNVNLSYSQKIKNNLIIIISFSIIAFTIAYHTNKNKSLKYGLYFGASLLFLHSAVYNWHSMNNDTKMIVAFFCLICLIWYSFSSNNKNNKNNKNNENNENDNSDELNDDELYDETDDDEPEDKLNLVKYSDTYIEQYVK